MIYAYSGPTLTALKSTASRTAFVKRDNEYLFWVPRRAATKQTWPGCLDNSVAGGITAGDNPWETIVRECGGAFSRFDKLCAGYFERPN